MQVEEALEILKKIEGPLFKRGESPCGARHFYVQLNDDWGVKFYKILELDWNMNKETDELRKICLEASWLRQKKAAALGLAPQVGEILEFDTEQGKYHGFITEHVESINMDKDWSYKNMDEFGNYYSKEKQVFYKVYSEQGENLVKNLRKNKLSTSDFKPANCGVTKQGKLVYIDFGDESMDKNRYEDFTSIVDIEPL